MTGIIPYSGFFLKKKNANFQFASKTHIYILNYHKCVFININVILMGCIIILM